MQRIITIITISSKAKYHHHAQREELLDCVNN